MSAEPALSELEEALGYRFSRPELLATALCHASYAHEHPERDSNERLEFLGDAVIGLVVGHELFVAHPTWQEGNLTRALHALVDGESLARLARELDLGAHLELGRTERRSDGRRKDSILADAMEAVLGAMFLDGGLPPVEALVRRSFADALRSGAPPVDRDPKTRLQEMVMARRGEFPSYRVVGDSGIEGDDQRFRVEVWVQRERWGEGIGRSKRRAEREAAEHALPRAEREAADDAAPRSGSEAAAEGEADA